MLTWTPPSRQKVRFLKVAKHAWVPGELVRFSLRFTGVELVRSLVRESLMATLFVGEAKVDSES